MQAATVLVNGAPPADAPVRTEDLHGKAREAIAADGLSQTRAALEIGISDSALSQWLAGKYGGDGAAVGEKVRRWIESRAARAALLDRLPDAPEWVATPTARRIEAGLSYAQLAGDMAVIYGGSGLGKTVTARRYAAKRPNAWLATMTPATHALGPCLECVMEACGVRAPRGRAAQLEATLRERVEGARGLLIVDEAQHLSLRALEALRGLHDATGAGLALIGNETIYTRLTGGRRRAEFAQLFSRIGKRVRLMLPEKGDVAELLDAWGEKLAGGKELRALALAIAQRHGGLRGLTKTLRLAALFSGAAPVEARHIRAAWKDLGGGA